MILPIIKGVKKVINFLKAGFKSKGSFRNVTAYVNGLIALGKKTVNKISQVSPEIKHQSALNRVLTESKFEKEKLEERFLKKIKYLFKNFDPYLIFDDTLVEREGKKVELTKYHHNHNTDSKVKGHQFLTSMIYTPFLQLPLFPELYAKESDSKIEMAKSIVKRIARSKIPIHTTLFDSWYSDEKLIKLCESALKSRVICSIKTNRIIKFKRERKYWKLSFITDRIPLKDQLNYTIDDNEYKIAEYQAHLHKMPNVKLIISQKYSKKEKSWNKIHLISTNKKDSVEDIICAYKIRWCIETYHRDIKQNLGFAEPYFRKEAGIVRHSILVIIAYVVLKLYMFRKEVDMTIGECCEYLRDESNYNHMKEIVEIENKPERLDNFEEAFISKSRKL